MKIRWIKACRWLLGLLGTSVAIASCSDINSVNLPSCEYGTPSMDFSIKGKVVDSKTGAGIAGIEVSYAHYGVKPDTTLTDGSFEISGNAFYFVDFPVELKDIDPEKDGSYKSVKTTVHLDKVKDGTGSWHWGTFEAKDAVLKMEEENGE